LEPLAGALTVTTSVDVAKLVVELYLTMTALTMEVADSLPNGTRTGT